MTIKNIFLSMLLRAPQALFLLAGLFSLAHHAVATEFVFDKNKIVFSKLDVKNSQQLNGEKNLSNSLQVFAGDSAVPMLGKVSWHQNTLVFTPRFDFESGIRYRAVVKAATMLEEHFYFPAAKSAPSANIKAIYPTGNELPRNVFKFYLHFTEPMSRGEAYQHIRLLNQRGVEVELPFLELGEELWNREGTRFTLLFDPGRIKQGLVPNRNMGLPLTEGEEFTLVVDTDWPDAEGVAMQRPFAKTFRVGPVDNRQPKIENWQLSTPPSGSDQALTIVFDEPLDHALLFDAIRIETASGENIAGRIEVDNFEQRWRFYPAANWRAGQYTIVAAAYLEDRAANSLGRAFEVIRTSENPEIPTAFYLPFYID